MISDVVGIRFVQLHKGASVMSLGMFRGNIEMRPISGDQDIVSCTEDLLPE